jgi:two-component system sensor histidine kinase VicK
LEAAFDAMAEVVIIFDQTNRMVRMNRAGKAMLRLEEPLSRYTARDLIARMRLSDLHGRPLGEDEWPLPRALSREEKPASVDAQDIVIGRYDGRTLYLSVSKAPLYDAQETVVGASIVARDVTAQWRLEQEQSGILQAVAHDLGTPLGAVSLYVQTQLRQLRKGTLPRLPDRDLLQVMEHSLKRAARLVNDLQVAVGITSGQIDFALARCDLVVLCRQEGEAHRLATGRDVHIVAPDQPVEALADADRIGQVLGNLLSNAHKYSPMDRPVTLSLRLTDDGRQALIAVRDSGQGIPRRERKRIWERFHRVEGVKALPGASGNLGLGLYISKTIVERHGGQIAVRSAVNKGSTFFFTLPLLSAAAAIQKT